MMAVMTRRKKTGPTLEEGIPKGYGKTVANLDVYEIGSLEQLLASRISVTSSRAKPIKVAGHVAELSTIDVDDPLEYGAKLTATRNIRNDPLARLHSHHQIDDAQFYAGRAYQRDWETAERGAQAIDPTKEAVDGGRIPEPLSDAQGKARIRLVEIEGILGRTMQRVIHAVLIEGMSMEIMALQLFGRHGETAAKYYGRMFRDALDELAREYRLATR